MKLLLCAIPLSLWPLGSLEASAPATAACNAMVSVIDPDPAGTNVRKTPGGDIAATLRPPRAGDDWIEVHVVGQTGDWFAIDRAELVGGTRETIYRGRGYMHRAVLGSEGLVNGEPIRADHNERAAQILAGQDADQAAHLLSCAGGFVKIRIKAGVGWTRRLCLNQRTTCA